MVRLPSKRELKRLHEMLDGLCLDILGRPYTVEIKDFKDDPAQLGECSPIKRRIGISRKAIDPLVVLIHEAWHAVQDAMGDEELSEKEAVKVESVLTQLFRHNPIFKELWLK